MKLPFTYFDILFKVYNQWLFISLIIDHATSNKKNKKADTWDSDSQIVLNTM